MSLEEDATNLWKQLGEPSFVVAPMVDASELAWRMLCRNHGAELCYTPMLHSFSFVNDTKYRETLTTCNEDRPLIVQFCANDPSILLKASLLLDNTKFDGIDINLGCPQSIAKRGHYGAFLQDEWDLLGKMIKTLRQNQPIPVSCKIRIFKDVDKSIKYAKMLEDAGCQMLTVHGRTREQKGPLTGVADWSYIKAIKAAVSIPVLANGNIQYLNDVHHCLRETRCDGVMSAEGILHNPALFEGTLYTVWEMALEYLDLVVKYPCPLSYTRGHLFKLFHHLFSLIENDDLRKVIAHGQSVEEFLDATLEIKRRYEKLNLGLEKWEQNENYHLSLPPWICQPWVRMSPEDHLKKLKEIRERDAEKKLKNPSQGQDNNITNSGLSKNLIRKMKRRPNLNPHSRRHFPKCMKCLNPVSLKCENQLCKVCCRKKFNEEGVTCKSHGIIKKSKN